MYKWIGTCLRYIIALAYSQIPIIHFLTELNELNLNDPNPDTESQFRVQVIDMHNEFTKTKYTSLMKNLFEDF